ncbi:MAG: hypothetical protein NT023_01240 [Armatimonadetes bacterium]|nr:hypothetical protein [Armatimonadota bacterium]
MENTKDRPEEQEPHPSGEEPLLPTYSEDGEDLTLIRLMLSLTPIERLRTVQRRANSIQRLRNARKTV